MTSTTMTLNGKASTFGDFGEIQTDTPSEGFTSSEPRRLFYSDGTPLLSPNQALQPREVPEPPKADRFIQKVSSKVHTLLHGLVSSSVK